MNKKEKISITIFFQVGSLAHLHPWLIPNAKLTVVQIVFTSVQSVAFCRAAGHVEAVDNRLVCWHVCFKKDHGHVLPH